MDNSAFFKHSELRFRRVKAGGSLMRWLDKQSIPYLVDAKGRPKVKYASVEKIIATKDAEEEKNRVCPRTPAGIRFGALSFVLTWGGGRQNQWGSEFGSPRPDAPLSEVWARYEALHAEQQHTVTWLPNLFR